jgi:anti-sigma factor RsiW
MISHARIARARIARARIARAQIARAQIARALTPLAPTAGAPIAGARIVAALAACLVSLTAVAQTAPPTRVRGTITAVDAHMMTVKARNGQTLEIRLNDPLTVSAVKNVDPASIGAGTYVGVATRPGPNGSLTAIEVLVFPEATRGAGEGHYNWDLEPGSMMTNGSVSGEVNAASGHDLSITYKGGSNTVTVPPNTPVVTFIPAERADLKAGATVFLGAAKNPEGQLTASRVTVSKDGVAPPM